jgi:hypothetical protein
VGLAGLDAIVLDIPIKSRPLKGHVN